MARALADFRTLFPEISIDVASDDTVNAWLSRGEMRLEPSAWGVRFYDHAVLLWAAHHIALGLQRAEQGAGSSPAGALTQAKVGDIQTGYAQTDYATSGDPDEIRFAQTHYGREYLAYRDEVFAGGLITSPVVT